MGADLPHAGRRRLTPLFFTHLSPARSPSGPGRFPFKEEVRGSNPLRATDRVVVGLYAIRFPYRPLLCCEGPFSERLFSAIAARDAVKGDGALRRSSKGLALQYRSTIRPVVHPPSTCMSNLDPDPERWKFVAQVCRSMCAQRSGMPVRTLSRSKSFRMALPVSPLPRRSVKSDASRSLAP